MNFNKSIFKSWRTSLGNLMLSFALFCALTPHLALSQPQNMVQNGDFAAGNANWEGAADSPRGKVAFVDAQVSVFNRAVHVVTTPSATDKPWTVALRQKITQSLKKGEKLTLRLWARAPTGGKVGVVVEQGKSPFAKAVDSLLRVTPQWSEYEVKGEVPADFAIGEARLSLYLSFEPTTVDISGVRLYRGDVALPPLSKAQEPLFAEKFNALSGQVQFKNGASLGVAGSGVSGTPDDKAYVATVANFDAPASGPVASITSPYPVDGLTAKTVTAWYKSGTRQVTDVTLMNAGGFHILKANWLGWSVRVDANVKMPAGSYYWFSARTDGPYAPWLVPDEWIFVAFVWDMKTSTTLMYQGTKAGPVKQAWSQTHIVPDSGLIERANRDKILDTIGNAFGRTFDRPFNGSIDNLRVYGAALDASALEKIRQADIENKEPTGF